MPNQACLKIEIEPLTHKMKLHIHLTKSSNRYNIY